MQAQLQNEIVAKKNAEQRAIEAEAREAALRQQHEQELQGLYQQFGDRLQEGIAQATRRGQTPPPPPSGSPAFEAANSQAFAANFATRAVNSTQPQLSSWVSELRKESQRESEKLQNIIERQKELEQNIIEERKAWIDQQKAWINQGGGGSVRK